MLVSDDSPPSYSAPASRIPWLRRRLTKLGRVVLDPLPRRTPPPRRRVPPGFIPNAAFPSFLIPHEGRQVVAPFIRRPVDEPTYIQGTFGPHQPIFAKELFAQAVDTTESAPSSLPGWVLRLFPFLGAVRLLVLIFRPYVYHRAAHSAYRTSIGTCRYLDT